MNAAQIAQHIKSTVKSANKDLNYALSIVEWYSSTDSQDKEVKMILTKIWN